MPRFHSLVRLAAAAALSFITAGAIHAGVLLDATFNSGSAWPALAASTQGTGVSATAATANNGTIDTLGSSTASGAVALTVNAGSASGAWSATLSSGRLAVSNTETHLGKLTVSFDLWTSQLRPVRVRIQSYQAATGGSPSGARESVLVAPVAGSFYRFSLDLSSLTASGGSFAPLAPFIELQFEINSSEGADPWPAQAGLSIRVDNVSYTSPAYYVNSQSGNNTFTGRTETQAFATVQKAVDVAQPGDVIVIMPGSYTSNTSAVVSIPKAGSPARWIVLRAHPDGPAPDLVASASTWGVVRMNENSSFLEIRGLSVKGRRAVTTLADAEVNYNAAVSPAFNGNGIEADGRPGTGTQKPHHLRVIGNEVADNCGGGISFIDCDYITVAGNLVHHNCWYMRYGGSGISFLTATGVDASTDTKMFIVGNIAYRNQCFIKWKQLDRYSDGNGIIIDSNKDDAYAGRTLVQNNVAFGNGGSGIHNYKSAHIDFINNTAYYNGQSPALGWGEIFVNNGTDVNFANNILWAPAGHPINANGNSNPSSNVNVSYANNLYHGDGNNYLIAGTNDLSGRPLFARLPTLTSSSPTPDVNADVGSFDFSLLAGSPGLDRASLTVTASPRLDLAGRYRPLGSGLDCGAYELVAAVSSAPSITTQPASQAVNAGATATLSVAASGASLTYQWSRNTAPVSGATSSTLTLTSVQTAQAGSYTVTVTNSFGSTTSAAASLAVLTPPADQSVTVGRSVTLSAGTGGSFQWQISTNNGSTWTNLTDSASYTGTTTANLTVVNADASLTNARFRVLTTTGPVVTTGASLTLFVNAALVPNPTGLVADGSGDLAVADSSLNLIQTITPAGLVSVRAGTSGQAGSTDATAAAARFNQPSGLARQASGAALFLADTGNATIRRIAADGTTTTFAGAASSRGNQDGTAATFSSPIGLAFDAAGNLYVADEMNHTIRKLTAAGTVSTFAGAAGISGTTNAGSPLAARFNHPAGVAFDSAGNLYIADTFNHTIRKVTPAGTVSTFAGLEGVAGSHDGSGPTDALFNKPTGLTTDSANNLYVTDTANSTIRKITPAGVVTTFAGVPTISGLKDGAGSEAWFNQPQALDFDDLGNLYVADTGNAAIRKITPTGTVLTLTLTTAANPAPAPAPAPSPSPTPTPAPSSGGGGGGAVGPIFLLGLGLLVSLRIATTRWIHLPRG